MRDVVRDSWVAFTEPIEGGVATLYNDIRGLTTIAYGDLCNSPGEAAALPMTHLDGTFATSAEKIAAWEKVHNDPMCAVHGWRYAASLTPLRLTRDGMEAMALRKLDQNETALAHKLAFWADMPACAQMAMHSLAWACGANAFFPRLYSALNVHDYEAAAVEIHMNEWTKGPTGAPIHNSGLVPRNLANKLLMRNAARVESYHLDPDMLNWKTLIGIENEDAHPDMTNPASYPTLCPDPPDEPPQAA